MYLLDSRIICVYISVCSIYIDPARVLALERSALPTQMNLKINCLPHNYTHAWKSVHGYSSVYKPFM